MHPTKHRFDRLGQKLDEKIPLGGPSPEVALAGCPRPVRVHPTKPESTDSVKTKFPRIPLGGPSPEVVLAKCPRLVKAHPTKSDPRLGQKPSLGRYLWVGLARSILTGCPGLVEVHPTKHRFDRLGRKLDDKIPLGGPSPKVALAWCPRLVKVLPTEPESTDSVKQRF